MKNRGQCEPRDSRVFELEEEREELEWATRAADIAFQELDSLKEQAQPGRGEIWMVDRGLAAKVRPCLPLADWPADNELALIAVPAHTRSLEGNPWEHAVVKPFLKTGAFHLQQVLRASRSSERLWLEV